MTAVPACPPEDRYRHEAFFYADDDEYLDGTLRFIRDAVEATEPILALLAGDRIEMLRAEVEADGDLDLERICFADMDEVGANPARIIPAWQDFISEYAQPGRRVRGIGEPISASRGAAELAECQRHEALLNLAFADRDFWLLCPYDTESLELAVIDEARRTHPYVHDGDTSRECSDYAGSEAFAAPFDWALSEPDAAPSVLGFRVETVRDVRSLVEQRASAAGLSRERTEALVLSVYEISTNSVQHGGGEGMLRVWSDRAGVVCEVRDAGHITDPMLGRVRPSAEARGGRGLWLANQLCDLVQVRSFATETVTRLHMRFE